MPSCHPLKIIGATVVVTGASSGLGRATALAFAREGAHLVLAARGREALDAVTAECAALGARTLAVPTDSRDPAAVAELAATAVRLFGRIDVWIDNAASAVDAGIGGMPGRTLAADAVLPYYRAQQHGVLVNVITPGSPPAAHGAEDTGTAGLRRFSDSVVAPLFGGTGVQVYEVDPGLLDAPGLRHEAVADMVLALARPPGALPRALARVTGPEGGSVLAPLLLAAAALGLVGAVAYAISRARR